MTNGSKFSTKLEELSALIETLCKKLDEVSSGFGNLFTGIGGSSEEAILYNLLRSQHAPLVMDGVPTWLTCTEDLKVYLESTSTTGKVVTMGKKESSSFFDEALCRSALLAYGGEASTLEHVIGLGSVPVNGYRTQQDLRFRVNGWVRSGTRA